MTDVQGAKTDAAWNKTDASTTEIAILKAIATTAAAGGGGAVTVADAADVAQGAVADAAYASGNGTVVSLLKGLFARLRGGQATKANSMPMVLASDSDALPVNPASGAAVALSSPPAALTGSADTTFTFASAIRHVLVQNNSGTVVGVAFDTAATAGSAQVAANGGVLSLDAPVTAVHMYSTAATNVNGSSVSNIVLLGWA